MIQAKIKKISLLILGFSAVSLAIFPFIQNVKGQAVQQANLQITPGTITLTTPSDFSFDPVFVEHDATEPFYIYKQLDPLTAGRVLRISDADALNNFKVTMNISNLTSGVKEIPFSNVSFVTVAENAAGIDTEEGNSATNFTTPAKCVDDPNKPLAQKCSDTFEPITGDGEVSNAIDLVTSTEPNDTRTGTYSIGLGFKILIDPTVITPGTYDGDLTFSLYQCADESCL